MLRILRNVIGQVSIRFARDTAPDQSLPHTEDEALDGHNLVAEAAAAEGQHVLARLRTVLAGAALLAMTLAAYAPALTAGFIWDDHQNLVENQTLLSRNGLRQMWFAAKATTQYCPLTYSSYWIEYRLWGLVPRGYHLTNVLLHGAAVILAWRLLVRLRLPGAWFAAALFAVHPVEVESVAWITERKNVLSLPLVLLSMLCYLRFSPAETQDRGDETPAAARWRWYALAFAFFALALTANTVVATMPAVMLVIYWWKRGRITRHDVACILPFFALSLAFGLLALRMEGHDLGTHGEDWSLPLTERWLLAGRAVWFYGGKLLWPHPLVFFYERWTMDGHAWGQYLWPVAAVALLVGLWLARGRLGRGPLAAVLIFAIALAPMLGFFDDYFMKDAYVADHFQYHASLAILALLAATVAIAFSHLRRSAMAIAYTLAGLVLLGLGSATFQHTFIFHDFETLYRDTIAKNPRCTTAYVNLAVCLVGQGNHEEAIDLTRNALRLDATDPLAHINLATFLLVLGSRDGFKPGQLEETIEHLREGLSLSHAAGVTPPDESRLRNYLGFCIMQTGYSTGLQPQLLEEVITELNEAVRLDPGYVEAHLNLALALAAIDRPAEAIQHAALALELEPQGADELRDRLGPDLLADALCARGTALASKGEFATAEELYKSALELRPDHDRAPNNLGVVLMNQGKIDEAIHWFEEAVLADSKYDEAKKNLEKARQVQSDQGAKK